MPFKFGKWTRRFIVDPATGVYYVFNVSWSPGKKDNDAFIAKIDPGGKLTDRDFIRAGKNGVHLNAPEEWCSKRRTSAC